MPVAGERVRVLIAGAPAGSREVEVSLRAGGFDVLDVVGDEALLETRVRELAPDVVIIHKDSPARDTLEHLALLHQRWPRPLVMLSPQGDRQIARAAAQAGVSFYVVEHLSPQAVGSLIDMAVLHFQDHQLLRAELAQARQALEDRRAVDDAKCLLMEREALSEAESYHRLRRLAMRRGQRLADLARALLAQKDRAAGMAIAFTA